MNINDLYFILIPLLLCVFGIFSCFWGYGFFRFMLIIVGFFFGIFITIKYGTGFISDRNILIISAIAVGILLGILVIIFYFAGIFLSGAIATLFILNYAGLKFDFTQNILIMIGVCVAGGLLSLIFQRFMIVITTAIIGSFCIINGIGFLVYNIKFGILNFEKYFYSLQSSNDLYYLLMFITAILSVTGIIYQLKMIPEKKYENQ